MTTSIIVPAYFYPDGNTFWDDLTSLAASQGNAVTAIVNPNNGPGASVNADYTIAINNLVTAGGSAVGYVFTSYGVRAIADVKADIAAYISQYPQVTGFFFDEMANLPEQVAYYQELYNFVKTLGTQYTVIGNPGVNTLESYVSTADILVTFEGTGAAYLNYVPLAWQANYAAKQFSHLVYGVTNSADIAAIQLQATATGGGNLYITDDVYVPGDPAAPNPWDALSSYYLDNLINGNAANNYLSGNSGADTIDGGAGDDTLNGGIGADSLIGGSGNDVFIIDNIGDVIVETAAITTTTGGTGTNTVSIISTKNDGAIAASHSYSGSLSADGNKLIFSSWASNYVANDINGRADIFVKDLITGTVTLVSATNTGAQGTNGSYGNYYGILSRDGQSALFQSDNLNLVGNTGNTPIDQIYMKNLSTGGLSLVSASATGVAGNAASSSMAISNDNRYVIFESTATNLVAGSNSFNQLYVKDLVTGSIQRVSNNAAGLIGNNESNHASFSADGQNIVFISAANNLVANDNNFSYDVFVKNLSTGIVKLVSSDSLGNQANGGSSHASFSADGRYVSFESRATNLIPGLDTTPSYTNLFRKDLITGEIKAIDTSATGISGNFEGEYPSLSSDGRYAVFTSRANNLVANDTNNDFDVFVKDLTTGDIKLVSADLTGKQFTPYSYVSAENVSAFSADDNFILVYSAASNTLPNQGAEVIYKVSNPFKVGGGVTTTTGGGIDRIEASISIDLSVKATEVENLTLTGTAAINGTGNALNNVIIGNTAANILDGGVGADSMDGGLGDDTYVVDNANDSVTESTTNLLGGGNDLVKSSVTFTLGNNLDQLNLTGTTAINGTGNTLNNTIIGNGANNVLNGLTGNDTLTGGAGSDTFVLSSIGMANADTITDFTSTTDKLNLSGPDFAALSAGIYTDMFVSSATGTVTALDINDFILYNKTTGDLFYDADANGAGAAQLITKLSPNSTLLQSDFVNALTTAQINPNPTNLTLTGTALADTLAGGAGNDTINGLAGNDVLDGAAGADTIDGGAGDDTLNGGIGADSLIGGSGNDVFIIDNIGDVIVETAAITTTTGGTGTNTVSIISTKNDGAIAASHSYSGSLSADGNKLIFSSWASNYVANDINGRADIFVKDLITGTVTLVSATNTGAQGTNGSYGNYYGILSRDGQSALFQSDNLNLVGNTGNTPIDQIYMKNLSTGGLSLVSASATGVAGNAASSSMAISNDNRYVIFESTATNLVAGSNSFNQLYVKDLVTGSIQRVSNNAAGLIGNNESNHASFSADGQNIVFISAANNLVANDNNFSYDVFVKNLSTGIVKLVSSDSLGNQANGGSSHASFSADGRYVSFESRATNLIPGLDTTPSYTNLFRKDLITGEIKAIDTSATGISGNFEGEYPSLSSDGRYAVFTSRANNLVANDTNNDFDVFVKDLTTGDIKLVSADLTGKQFTPYSYVSAENVSAFSADDNFILVYSAASNTLPNQGAEVIYKVSNPFKVGGGVTTTTGGGIDRIEASISIDLSVKATEVENLTLTGTAAINGTGNALNNVIIGNTAANILDGGVGADSMDGGLGDDTIIGGSGADSLAGNIGSDTFKFNFVSDSPFIVAHDIIQDFNRVELDKIDLFAIDANTSILNDQAFTFIGNNVAFSNVAGQLRFDTVTHSIFGDVNGDGVADFQVELTGVTTMLVTDFIL
jgi:trimeric autotransporter adhesin